MPQTRQQILDGATASPEQIEIPEWGGAFQLLPLSGEQYEEITLLAEQARATGNYLCLKGIRGRVATWVVADEEGKRVFQPADAPALTTKYSAVLSRVFERVKTMNAMTEEEIGDIEKN